MNNQETTLQRVWEILFETLFKKARRRIVLSTFMDDIELSTGDKILESIDRIIRPSWWAALKHNREQD